MSEDVEIVPVEMDRVGEGDAADVVDHVDGPDVCRALFLGKKLVGVCT